MRSAAAFCGPMTAAVVRVNNRSFSADGPTFLRVDKLHVQQIRFHTRFLLLPRAAAVRRAIDDAGTADRPTKPVVEKRSRREPHALLHARQGRLIPRVAAVGSLNDRGTRADNPAA